MDTAIEPGVAFHYRHIRQREDTDMQARTLLQRSALVIAVAVVPTAIAGAAQAAGGHAAATKCATVKVRATPQLNTAMVPETITSKVTSCATATETVKLVQHISGPSAASMPMDKTWTITLSPGQTVKKVRSFPYSCCGSYTVTDTVTTTSGHKLAKASSNFTFA
jgi:hypothetical protein